VVGLFLLILAGISVRAWISVHIPVIPNDAADGYLLQARELLRGNWRGGIGTYFSPGFPFLVALLALFHLDIVTAGKLVSVLSGALLVLPVFGLAREVYEEKVAWVAATLCAFYPVLVEYSADALSEGAFTLLLLTAAWLATKYLYSTRYTVFTVCGVVYGAAYLVRGEGLVYYLSMLAWFWLARLAVPRTRRVALLRGGLCTLVGFCALAIAYVLFLHQQTGHWQISGKTMENLLAFDIGESGERVDMEKVRLGLSTDGERLQIHDKQHEGALSFLWNNRGREIRRFLKNASAAYIRVLPRSVYPLYWLLAGAGLVSGIGERTRWVLHVWLLSTFVIPFLIYPMFLLEVRYFTPVSPIALVWAAKGINLISDSLVGAIQPRRPQMITVCLVAAIVILHSYPLVELANRDPWSYPLEHKAAGEWLKVNGIPHARIMNRKSFVAFYAEGYPVITPAADLEGILRYAVANGVDYFVVDERYTVPVRPQLQSILEGQVEPRLDLIYSKRPSTGKRISIYRFRKQASIDVSQVPGESVREISHAY
jgi:4-amino-4-deoxy-L-arabinose transferase-like glycosyltransferase